MPATAPASTNQPVFVLCALFTDYSRLDSITQDFIQHKRRFFPALAYRSTAFLDAILPEIKGADLRRHVAVGGRNTRRHTMGFLDGVFDLLQRNDVKIVARVWIKGLGHPLRSNSVYTASAQRLYQVFDHYLTTAGDYGLCVIDSRTKGLNVRVAHSIFTQKFSAASPAYPRVAELPGFVHSENHAGIQLADLVSSAILYPVAAHSYCSGHVANVHVQPNFALLKTRYGGVLKTLQYRFPDANGRFRGGITVSDAIAGRSSALMFR